MHLPNSKTVREVALLLKTSEKRVRQLIESKQLARNISQGKKQPRWAILDEYIDEYRNGSDELPQVIGVAKKFF